MKLVRLYIENFMCYEYGFVDFREFSAALIVGKKENNDHIANGVGKTTIFKAIEYVLFNYADIPLERVIRDDIASCRVVLDFMVGDQEYRLSRTRSKKSTDLTLLQRKATDGQDDQVYHAVSEMGAVFTPYTDKKEIEGYWKDMSGSRAGDTEKELAKLIKINQKAFRSTILFRQNDTTGLPTVTPEKRKGILKEALNLGLYAKLEKIAKERAAAIAKDIDKHKLLIEGLGDPNKDLVALEAQLVEAEKCLAIKIEERDLQNAELAELTDKVNQLNTAHANIESKFASLLATEKSLLADKSKLEISIKEYTSKKGNVIKSAREMVTEVNALKEQQTKLAALDYAQIDILTEAIEKSKEAVSSHNMLIKLKLEELDELKIPLPTGSKCKNCRKPMTDKDRKEHKAHIDKDMKELQTMVSISKKTIADLNSQMATQLQTVNNLNLSKQQLESINTKIAAKSKEIRDKSTQHDDYAALLTKFKLELEEKEKELTIVAEELKNSSIEEANILKKEIAEVKKVIIVMNGKIAALNKEVANHTSMKAVLLHSIEQKTKDNTKKKELKKALEGLEKKFTTYPSVIQAFSTTGIPNIIIQNVLDDLQVEANNLLSQIKPEIQLSFAVEKTVEKTGDQADTLEIDYTINGRDRYYEQLSGAQQIATIFALKLGLSILLQNMIGTDIKFLLFDELDQSLDKASVDYFADMVKFFQKDYTILVITHNDRLKDKFSHAILVEQDGNDVSRAKVVSSW